MNVSERDPRLHGCPELAAQERLEARKRVAVNELSEGGLAPPGPPANPPSSVRRSPPSPVADRPRRSEMMPYCAFSPIALQKRRDGSPGLSGPA
jgi:hypothetical protein